MTASPYVRACMLRAEGDGVAPTLILQAEKGAWHRTNHGTSVGPPQYMFGGEADADESHDSSERNGDEALTSMRARS